MNKRLFGNENKYIQEVLNEEFRSSSGATMMRRLEQKFAEVYGVEYAISFVNGTATMHAALEAMGIGPGDEVIVPPLTMSATTFAVLHANATPIFADVDPRTFQISPKSIIERTTDKTKAIITVALYGMSPDMDPIMEHARSKGIFVLEDNAECFLGEYKGNLVGTIGDCASFSFQSSKHLSSGEGGMIITNNGELATKIRQVQSLGYAGVGAKKAKISKEDIQNPNYSRHVSMGWNYRMPELCCAVALAQTENIEDLVGIRVQAAKIFEQASAEHHDWFVPQFVPEGVKNTYWTWVVRLDPSVVSWKDFYDKFVSLGGDGPYGAWKLTYLEPMFQNRTLLGREDFIDSKRLEEYRPGLCPVAEALQGQLLQFKTNYWDLSEAEKQAEILRKTLIFFGKASATGAAH